MPREDGSVPPPQVSPAPRRRWRRWFDLHARALEDSIEARTLVLASKTIALDLPMRQNTPIPIPKAAVIATEHFVTAANSDQPIVTAPKESRTRWG
jgi:hypothetical protein